MDIYFCGSISGGRDDVDAYKRIIQELSEYGDVLSAHIGDTGMGTEGDADMSSDAIYERDISWLNMSDIVIAEISTASHGVGYEVRHTRDMETPIYCLYNTSKRISPMIEGAPHTKIIEYDTDTVAETIHTIMKNYDN